MLDSIHPIQQEINTVFTRTQEKGLLSGIDSLDEILCGFHNQRLYVIGAAAKMGKTSLMTDIAINISKFVPVVMFSLEQSFDELQKRVICNIANANYFKVQQGQQKDKIDSAIPIINKLSLWIDDKTSIIYSGNIVRYLREQNKPLPEECLNKQIDFHVKNGVKLIIIDYLNLMRLAGKAERDDLRIHEIMWQLHTMAKHYNIPIITACQLNRESRKKGERPQLTGLKDSTHIEADCDVAIMIHRPAYYRQQSFDKMQDIVEDDAELIIAANRQGPCGIVGVSWKAYCMSFCSKNNGKF